MRCALIVCVAGGGLWGLACSPSIEGPECQPSCENAVMVAAVYDPNVRDLCEAAECPEGFGCEVLDVAFRDTGGTCRLLCRTADDCPGHDADRELNDVFCDRPNRSEFGSELGYCIRDIVGR